MKWHTLRIVRAFRASSTMLMYAWTIYDTPNIIRGELWIELLWKGIDSWRVALKSILKIGVKHNPEPSSTFFRFHPSDTFTYDLLRVFFITRHSRLYLIYWEVTDKMARSLAKVQKKITKKHGNARSLHENSRDAKKLRRAELREDKLARLSASRSKASQPICMWYSPGGYTLLIEFIH